MRERIVALAYRQGVEQIAGVGAIALLVLWGGYFVPQRLRHRNQLVESRVDDRFSSSLRVIAVANKSSASDCTAGDAECGVGAAKRNQLLTPAMGVVLAGLTRRELEGAVDVDQSRTIQAGTAGHGASRRPAPVRSPRDAQAMLPAARADVHARRAAAARRRLVLTLGLLFLTTAAWIATAAVSLLVAVPIVSTVLLGSVLFLGRRAVVAGQRADAAARRGGQRSESAPTRRGRAKATAKVVGRAVRGSNTNTEMISSVQVGERLATIAAGVAPEQAVTAADATPAEPRATEARLSEAPSADAVVAPEPTGAELSAYAVPRATYMSKATAPRREPAPLKAEDVTTPATASARAAAERAESARSAEEFSDLKPSPDGLGVDLNQILARRRAAGA